VIWPPSPKVLIQWFVAGIMRLLHIMTSGNFELKEFYATIPPYAIVSHRWEEEEVLIEDLTNNTATGKKRVQKK